MIDRRIDCEIPWWYVPFIKYMKGFWENLPKFEHGESWRAGTFLWYSPFGQRFYKFSDKIYNDTHHAYLKARWMALWRDLWTRGHGYGIRWTIQRGG